LRLSAEALMAPAAAPAPIASTGAAEASAPAPSPPVDGGSSAAEMLAALAQDGDSSARQPQAFGGGDEVRVILRARESSWIQVRSESRDYVRTRTLQPGDTFLVPNRSDLALWTGNAGGLEVLVDGRPIAELGGRGVVVRDVSLDPEQLLARGGG
jgi:cytoskeleton protein RodZ